MVHKSVTIVLILCSANLLCSADDWVNFIDVCMFRETFMTHEFGVNAYITNSYISVYDLAHDNLGLFTCLVFKNMDKKHQTLELEMSDEAYKRKIESNACRQYPTRDSKNELFNISTKQEVRVVTYSPFGSGLAMQSIKSIKIDGVEQINGPSQNEFTEAESVTAACRAHANSPQYNRFADCQYENVFKIFKIKIDNKLVWCYYQTEQFQKLIDFDLSNNNYNMYETYPQLKILKNIRNNYFMVNDKNNVNQKLPRIIAIHQINATAQPPAINFVRVNSKSICKTPLVEKTINCGRPTLEVRPFRTTVHPEQYPWIVSVLTKRTNWDLDCQGTLIDHETIITGASCVMNSVGEKVLLNNLRILPNKYDKTLTTDVNELLEIRDIIVSENYNKQYFEHDIALIKLKKPFALFGNDTMPICTTNNNDLFSDLTGVVTGFGLDRSSKPLMQLSQANIERLRPDVCRRRDSYFRVYLNENSYCAAYVNGTNICPDMAGSGMYIKIHDVWMLSGIVTIGVGSGERCSLSAVSLYSDIAALHSLIEANRS